MSANNQLQAQAAVKELMTLNEKELFTELGNRVHILQSNPALVANFSFQANPLESRIDARKIGEEFFTNINIASYNLCCKSTEFSKEIEESISKGETALATAVATMLISHLAVAAAIATAVSVIIVKILAKATGETLCQSWKEILPKSA